MRRFSEYTRELFCFIWYVSVSIFGSIVEMQNPELQGKKTIVIIHGLGAQPLAYIFLKRYLERKGFHVYFFNLNIFKSLGIGIENIDTISKSIKKFVEENNFKDITLLGMSAAVVPSLFFLERHSGWKYVKKFIALSGAFNGGWVSYALFFIPLSHTYNPNSWLQKEISHLSLTHPEKVVSLFGTWDEFVVPNSSLLHGVKNIQLTEGGHAYLETFSKKTFEKIVELAV